MESKPLQQAGYDLDSATTGEASDVLTMEGGDVAQAPNTNTQGMVSSQRLKKWVMTMFPKWSDGVDCTLLMGIRVENVGFRPDQIEQQIQPLNKCSMLIEGAVRPSAPDCCVDAFDARTWLMASHLRNAVGEVWSTPAPTSSTAGLPWV